MEPVGDQPRRLRWIEQLHRSRQQGHVQDGSARASFTFSPYRMKRQSPQNWPWRDSQLEHVVRRPTVFWRHWWQVTPLTGSYTCRRDGTIQRVFCNYSEIILQLSEMEAFRDQGWEQAEKESGRYDSSFVSALCRYDPLLQA